jgi:hypothetical protein
VPRSDGEWQFGTVVALMVVGISGTAYLLAAAALSVSAGGIRLGRLGCSSTAGGFIPSIGGASGDPAPNGVLDEITEAVGTADPVIGAVCDAYADGILGVPEDPSLARWNGFRRGRCSTR